MLRSIVACCGGFVLTGCVYVLSLCAELHLGLAILAVAGSIGAWLFFWLRLDIRPAAPADPRMLIVAATVTAASCIIVKEHGAYDAWLHWNSLAKYLSDPAYFKILQRPDSLWHADYPTGLTAPTGFIWRMMGDDPEWVPRAIGFLFYLAIPLLLCNVATRVNGPKYLWIAVLALFTVNYECLSQGINQYADVPLALFFLLALMCWDSGTGTTDKRWRFACGLMLGGCLLLKNEGAVIVSAFFLSRVTLLFKDKRTWSLVAAMTLPAAVLILYKRYIPIPNDVVAGLGPNRMKQFIDPSRYRIIGYNLVRFSLGRFPLFVIFFSWMAVWHRNSRLKISRDLLCLLLCTGGYLSVYLGTEIGLEWLVPTSMNRLMMQLLPAGVYVAIKGFADLKSDDRFIVTGSGTR